MKEREVEQTVIIEVDEAFLEVSCTTPEKVLCAAVLMGAIFDSKKKGDLRRKARQFFLNPDESYLFSFRSICTQLEIPPEKILNIASVKNAIAR